MATLGVLGLQPRQKGVLRLLVQPGVVRETVYGGSWMMGEINRTMVIEELHELDGDDPETAHINADGILCNLLRDLGYEDVVVAFIKIHKWYS
jgi:hypothetical protein